MAAAAIAISTATGGSIFTCSFSNTSGTRRSFSTDTTSRRSSFTFGSSNLGGVSLHPLRLCASAAPNPTDSSSPSTPTSNEGDMSYVMKLTVGSILGSALIKYGSVALPDITRPNIVQALLMIFTPAVVAVFLLVKESSKE